jgi:predicted ferric reductase
VAAVPDDRAAPVPTLTALVFVGLHTVAVFVDPYMGFTVAAVLIPFDSSYRPLAMALGITSSWVLLAVWISSQLQRRIGWRAWRKLHYGAFAVYVLALLHTILIGEDTQAGWGRWLIIGSVLVVTGLTAARLLDRRPASPPAAQLPPM